MSSIQYAAIGGGITALGFFLYSWQFIFLHGSSPSGKAYDLFVKKVCSSGDVDFLKTILTFGYYKKSFSRMIWYYRLKFFPVPTATLGESAPDAKIVTLDGQVKSLLKDYINVNSDIPLILNMGSYT